MENTSQGICTSPRYEMANSVEPGKGLNRIVYLTRYLGQT